MQSLVDTRCAGCHIGAASAGLSLGGNFKTNTVDIASSELPSMKRIKPGSRANSYLFHKLAGTHLSVGGNGVRMPRNGPYLSDIEIERVGRMIDGL